MAFKSTNSHADSIKKSKKRNLSDYNLYARDASSQSDDNVETESLTSVRDENACNDCGENVFPQTSFLRNVETPDILITKRSNELAGVQSNNTLRKEKGDRNKKSDKTSQLHKNNLHIVSDIKTKEKGEGRQVFFEANERKGETEEKLGSDCSENGTKRNFKGEICSVEEIENQSQGKRDTKRRNNRRFPNTKNFLSKTGQLLNDSASNHEKNFVERLNYIEKKESRSNLKKSKKKKYKRYFELRSMEESSKRDESENVTTENLSQALRTDQFNKVSPSPFDDVPGFRRSNTMCHRSRRITDDFHLPKSFSFDSKAPVIGREKWICFEEERSLYAETTSEKKVLLNVHSPQTATRGNDDNDDDKTILEHKVNLASKSVENLFEVLNKAVTQLKEERRGGDDQNELINDDDKWSEISDEIISLEFDTDEEKFCDTPVKQYPNVSLFQVSNPSCDLNNECNASLSLPEFDEGRNDVLDEYPPASVRNSWKFWYRYPDKKKKLSGRKWIPVLVHIDDGFLKINSLNGNTPEIRKEILLHQYCSLTTPVIHKGNKDGKVHSVKFEYVKFKELHRVKPRLKIEHVAHYTPVVKLSCRDMIALNDFINCVETVIRNVPSYRAKSLSYEHEEIFIDSFDKCSYLVSGEGHILKYNVTVQLQLKCFLSGDPELKLFLNDTRNENILSRTKEAISMENYKRTNVWITPENYEYHPCVNESISSVEGGVVFTPPDACSFELLRFRLRKRNPLPIIVKSSLEVLALNSVHLKAEVRVNGNAKNIRYKRNNVVLYIPVPSSWSKLFVKSRLIGRNVKYLNVKTSFKLHNLARDTNSRATFEVSTGTAKYEPAYGAIVWELGSLPIIRDGLAADATHTFQCFIELPFPLHIRDDFQPYSYLEFNVKQQMGSNVSVEELLLSDGCVPEKWVCYRSDFMYRIEMKILEDGKERTR